ncbi:MAG: 50S ribosomal protein L33 [Candidatus Omnitrophica bacterium]|nr:50S ribosomal protein L33 [Candidatus Omnitrophota bacterium]
MAAEVITMACGVCSRRNYTTRKNRKTHTDRLVRSKYCPFCRKHTEHKEHK